MILHQVDNSAGNYNYNAYTYSNMIFPTHFHGNYELIYTIKGIAEIIVNGCSYILENGECIVVSPYSTHSLNISKNTTAWVGVFSKDYILDFANKYPFAVFSKFKLDKQIEDFLLNNLFCGQKPDILLITGCLYLVFEQCLKYGKIFTQSDNIDFIKDVISHITENLANNVTMKETADKLNYEYHYFSALFNKYFSINFKRFINILRFEQACEILRKKEISVTDVCNECGFESIRNFNRIFKEFSGMTPGEYRKSCNRQVQFPISQPK